MYDIVDPSESKYFHLPQPELSPSGEGKAEGMHLGDHSYIQRIEQLKQVDIFLDNLKDKSTSEGFPPIDQVYIAENIWNDLMSEYETSLPVPLVSLGVEGSILFTFRTDNMYMEIEIVGELIEFYFENEQENKSEYQEFHSSLPVIENIDPWLLKIASSSS